MNSSIPTTTASLTTTKSLCVNAGTGSSNSKKLTVHIIYVNIKVPTQKNSAWYTFHSKCLGVYSDNLQYIGSEIVDPEQRLTSFLCQKANKDRDHCWHLYKYPLT